MSYLDRIEDRLERVSRYENYLVALCPFHDDHNPSFFVYEDFYICKSCGQRGNPEELLSRLDKSFRPKKAQYQPGNPFTKWLREMDMKTLCDRSAHLLQKHPQMGTYLHNRGIDPELITKVRIGYRDGWYIFPVTDQDGIIHGAVARNSDSKSSRRYMTPAGQEAMLYCPNWNRLKASRSVIVVYGIIDSVSLEKVGLASVTGTLGKRLNPLLLQSIRKNIYIIPDNGEEREAYILASALGWRGHVIDIKYPYGTKDVNDLLTKKPEVLREILNEMGLSQRDSSRVSDKQRVIA